MKFFSLQKGAPAAQVQHLQPQWNLIDFTPQLDEFVETAGLILQMDLVISVDTAVAHLAGALGKPVWNMLAADADWRWMLERADTPWYPTMELFRQPRPGLWQNVVTAIKTRLAEIVKNR